MYWLHSHACRHNGWFVKVISNLTQSFNCVDLSDANCRIPTNIWNICFLDLIDAEIKRNNLVSPLALALSRIAILTVYVLSSLFTFFGSNVSTQKLHTLELYSTCVKFGTKSFRRKKFKVRWIKEQLNALWKKIQSALT